MCSRSNKGTGVPVGNFGEMEILSAVANKKIILIKRAESQDNLEIIGVLVSLTGISFNEWGAFIPKFRSGIKPETIKIALLKIAEFAYMSRDCTKVSVILPDNENAKHCLIETNFTVEGILQRQIKTAEGFLDALLCSASVNGREIKPIELLATDLGKNRVISELKLLFEEQTKVLKQTEAELKAKNTALNTLTKEKDELQDLLKKENSKRIRAENQLLLLEEKIPKESKPNSASEITDLKALNRQFSIENERLKKELTQKSEQITRQGELIQELQKDGEKQDKKKSGTTIETPQQASGNQSCETVGLTPEPIGKPEQSPGTAPSTETARDPDELKKILRAKLEAKGRNPAISIMQVADKIIEELSGGKKTELKDLQMKLGCRYGIIHNAADLLVETGIARTDRPRGLMVIWLISADDDKSTPTEDTASIEIKKNKDQEIETVKPESPAEIKSMLEQAGFGGNTLKILEAIICNPGIRYPEIEKLTGISVSHIVTTIGKISRNAAGMIKKRYEDPGDTRIISWYPQKGILDKLREIAKEGEEKFSTLEIKENHGHMNGFDISVLALIIKNPDKNPDGYTAQTTVRNQLHENSGLSFNQIQPKISISVRNLAGNGLVTIKHTGNRNFLKPCMEKIVELPANIATKLGIQEPSAEKEKLPETADISQKVEAAIKIVNSGKVSLVRGIPIKELYGLVLVDTESVTESRRFVELLGEQCHISGRFPNLVIKPKIRIADDGIQKISGNGAIIPKIIRENGLTEKHGHLLVQLKNAKEKPNKVDLNGMPEDEKEACLKELEEKGIIKIDPEGIVELLIPL